MLPRSIPSSGNERLGNVGCSERVEQRHIVVRRGNGVFRIVTEVLIVDEIVPRACNELVPDNGIKSFRPRIRPCRPAPDDEIEIVHNVAGRHDQHTFIPQALEAPPQFEMQAWRSKAIDTQLHDGNIGGRIGLEENRPGPMVQAPVLVGDDRLRRQLIRYASGERRAPGAR